MEIWIKWGLPLVVVFLTAGITFLIKEVTMRWLDRQEDASKEETDS